MGFDWSLLGGQAPTALVRARHLAHHAAQWAARAARANRPPEADEGHCDLVWDAQRAALMSQALPAAGADVRIGLRIASLELVIVRGAVVLDTYTLEGRTDAMTAVWFDSALRALGLEASSGVTLPYSVPYHPYGKRAAHSRSAEGAALEELARWYDAAADLLGDVAARFAHLRPAPVRCHPHRFDIATRVSPDEAIEKPGRSIGIGFSPGDHHYSQPYVYVRPLPQRAATALPELPRPGHWHTQDFVAAVATGNEILALEDRAQALLAFIDIALATALARAAA